MADRSTPEAKPPFMFSHWEVFEPLRNHRSFILVFVLSAALSALALTYVFSEKYEAHTILFFKPTEVTRLGESTVAAFGAPVPQAAYKVVGATIEDLAKSDAILSRVVEKLHLDVAAPRVYTGPAYVRWYKMAKDYADDTMAQTWSFLQFGRVIDPDPTASAVETLRKDIKIKNNDSYLFVLNVRDKHRERVALIANELANELVSSLRNDEQLPAQERRTRLQEIVDQKRLEVESFKQQMTDLLNMNHLASIAQEIDKDTYRYSELELARLNLESEIRETQATVRSFSDRLDQRNTNGPTRMQADDFKAVSSAKLDAEVKLDGLLAKRDSLLQSLGGLSSALQRLPDIQTKYDVLAQEVERGNRDYSRLNDALEEAIVQEKNSTTEIVIESEAAEPDAPLTPIKAYHVALAAALGAFVAFGLCFVLGYFNIRMFIPSKGIRGRRPDAPQAAMADGPVERRNR